MKKLLPLLLLFAMAVNAQTLTLQTFASGFSSPVAIESAGDARLFVVQRGGAIRILNANGTINATNFLTLTSATISSGGERGLLGLAFHPNYATNGYFYVNYTRTGDGATVIARYSVSSTNPNVADASSALVLLTIAQPFSNHNGGSLVFGPDGFLYIGMGDGGSGGDGSSRLADTCSRSSVTPGTTHCRCSWRLRRRSPGRRRQPKRRCRRTWDCSRP
jgi:glucose/arabinose dehydrogenase